MRTYIFNGVLVLFPPSTLHFASRHWTALHKACCDGNADLVGLLLDHNADVTCTWVRLVSNACGAVLTRRWCFAECALPNTYYAFTACSETRSSATGYVRGLSRTYRSEIRVRAHGQTANRRQSFTLLCCFFLGGGLVLCHRLHVWYLSVVA